MFEFLRNRKRVVGIDVGSVNVKVLAFEENDDKIRITAFAVTDSNTTNNRSLDGWLRMGQARSVRDLREVLDRYQFLPWVNVIAADSTGTALYGDHSVVPRVTDELAAACVDAPFRDLYAASGQAVLDGSRTACALGADRDAAVPGILGPRRLPVLPSTPPVPL